MCCMMKKAEQMKYHISMQFFLLYKLFIEKIDILKVWLLHMYNNWMDMGHCVFNWAEFISDINVRNIYS